MIKNSVYIILFTLLATAGLRAQYNNDSLYQMFPKTKIYLKTNPLAMLQGPIILTSEFRICAERMTTKNQSLQITAAYLGKGAMLYLMESTQNPTYKFAISGARFALEYRWYAFNNDPNVREADGFYFAPAFSYSTAKITDKYSSTFNEYIEATYINYTLRSGYQILSNKLVLDMFVGFGYKNNAWTEHQNQSFSVLPNEDFEFFPSELKLVAGFNIGIAF